MKGEKLFKLLGLICLACAEMSLVLNLNYYRTIVVNGIQNNHLFLGKVFYGIALIFLGLIIGLIVYLSYLSKDTNGDKESESR